MKKNLKLIVTVILLFLIILIIAVGGTCPLLIRGVHSQIKKGMTRQEVHNIVDNVYFLGLTGPAQLKGEPKLTIGCRCFGNQVNDFDIVLDQASGIVSSITEIRTCNTDFFWCR